MYFFSFSSAPPPPLPLRPLLFLLPPPPHPHSPLSSGRRLVVVILLLQMCALRYIVVQCGFLDMQSKLSISGSMFHLSWVSLTTPEVTIGYWIYELPHVFLH